MSRPSLPERARVVVVGAGFAGAATAYYLTRAGVSDLLLLEAEGTCGHHASGRNAGLCRQLTDDDAITEMAMRGAEFLRQPPADFATRALLRQTGSLFLSAHASRLEALCADAARARLPHERVDGAAALSQWPRLAGMPAVGAVFIPTDGVIDIQALLTGFLTGAQAAGARVEPNARVGGFRPGREPMSVTVETSRGAVGASCVVNAAGAWAGDIGRQAGAVVSELTNYRRHLFLTEPVVDLDPQAPYFWYVDEEEMYGRPDGNGLLLCSCDGTAAAPGDAEVQPAAAAALHARLRRIAPGLADLSIERSWACLRTFTPDQRPRLGWDAETPWLFWVAGLGGHGATTSAAVGQMAADEILVKLGR